MCNQQNVRIQQVLTARELCVRYRLLGPSLEAICQLWAHTARGVAGAALHWATLPSLCTLTHSEALCGLEHPRNAWSLEVRV